MKLIIFIVLVLLLHNLIDAKTNNSILPKTGECGRLNKKYFYNASAYITQPDEYPWMAQIIYKEDNRTFAGCGAVLISKRHLLSVGHCLLHHQKSEIETVGLLLGKWQLTWGYYNFRKPDCNEAGDLCAPPAKLYEIDDIAINPDVLLEDIGVIRLSKEVEFSDYIQPICLPPPVDECNVNDFVGRFLYTTAYDREDAYKLKTVAQVKNFKDCTNQRDDKYVAIRDQHFTGNYFCAACSFLDLHGLSGSALMDVVVIDAEPKYFYLVGLSSITTGTCSDVTPDIYVKVAPFLKWIKNNMV